MKKFVKFMKTTRGMVLVALLIFGALFFAFTRHSGGGIDNGQRQKLLVTIGNLIEEQHYSPKQINDQFSKQVFKSYLDDLDENKDIFLAEDVASFKKYQDYLDDEIHGAEIRFVPAVQQTYFKRIEELPRIFNEILAHPFNFNENETYVSDGTKLDYPLNFADRVDRWRKKLKYLTLERFTDLQDQRNNSKEDSVKSKTDAQLEKEARNGVLLIIQRTYKRLKTADNINDMFNKYLNCILDLQDPHSDYFPPVDKRSFDEMMSGRFYGIGAQLQEQDGVVKIAGIVTGGPAWKSGELMASDVILKVAQGKEAPVDITGYDLNDAVKLIRGDKGTEVRLTIKRQDGTTKVISLIRDEVVIDEAFARSLIVDEGGKRIGYIMLPDFYADFERSNGARCSDDVAKEILKLKEAHVDGIVMDLRMNGGGSLYEVIRMLGFFLGKGPAVQVRDRDGKSSVLSTPDNNILYDGPLAVMVNEGSASASEIFAAAIQDYHRGVIIGSTSTYGKGTVQKSISMGRPLDFTTGRTEYGAVKLTFQKFYRINGGSTQLKGVTSDIVLPDIMDYMKIREKDNPSALPWDQIKASTYPLWPNNNFDWDSLIVKEKDYVQKELTLQLVHNNTLWLSKNMDSPIQLNIAKYRAQQKQLLSIVSQTTKLTKLTTPMVVEIPEQDKPKYYNNPDKAKGKRYVAWLDEKKTDFYLKQAVHIMEDMLSWK